MTYEEKRDLYDRLIAMTPGVERKGKTMPYTSSNGHMFSQLNKDGQIGIRLPKERGKWFIETYDSGEFRSYGAVMREYVLIPDSMLKNLENLSQFLKEGLDYVNSLPPK
jgi:hypothetical protein